MHANIFLVSDASYSYKTHSAGLGVINLSSNKKYTKILKYAKTSAEAEYHALLLSVQIAIKEKYNNVVFVYDCLSLDITSLQTWIKDKIQHTQFLWLKREFISATDTLAKKARLINEKLDIKQKEPIFIDKQNLLTYFKKYSHTKIVQACMSIANKDEYIVLKTYRDNRKHPPLLVDERSLDFYSDIYSLLSKEKNKKSFFKYIDKNYAQTIDVHQFKKMKPQKYYIEFVQKVILALSKKQKNV